MGPIIFAADIILYVKFRREMAECWSVYYAGDESSRPSLLRKSEGGCHFELVWYTAAACAVGRQYGDNCQVHYPAMGNTFIITGVVS